MSSNDRLNLETRVVLLEKQFEQYAPREWVFELIAPIRDSVRDIKIAVERQAEEARGLYESHKAMITKEEERREKLAEERTPMGLVRKYSPLVATIGGLVFIYRVLGTLAEVWLTSNGFKH